LQTEEEGGIIMAEEKEAPPASEKAEPAKKNKKGLFIMIAIVVVALAGGLGAYLLLFSHKGSTGGQEETKHEEGGKHGESKTALVALDAFVLNLSEQGRFLKLSLQFELADAQNQAMVTDKTPQLRDAIITLVSSKTVESVSSPEGKMQLKDELLLRANQAVGKDVFKNLYFTEFVMQ
jgi:flagellar FliL protein